MKVTHTVSVEIKLDSGTGKFFFSYTRLAQTLALWFLFLTSLCHDQIRCLISSLVRGLTV